MPDIIEKLDDLHFQATKERSHYYVGATVKEAAVVISRQRMALEMIKGALVGSHDVTAAQIMTVAQAARREGRS